MKKKVKKSNKIMKTIKIVLIVVIAVIGVFVAINLLRPKYLNNRSVCAKGYYYKSSIWCLFGCGCTKCPKGQYCPDGLHNRGCPKGTTTGGTGSSLSSSCKYCTDETKYYKNGSCVKCKEGYYCRGGELNKCPNGKTSKSGAKNESQCVCKSGTYKSGNSCKSCPKCNGTVTCFTSPMGSNSVNKCAGNVPAGKYITCSGSGCSVKACEGNTYSAKKKVTYSSNLKTSCTKCPSDKVANTDHTACVCKAGSYASGNSCKTCPKCNGNVTCFSSTEGAKSSSSCTGIVPKGKYITCNKSGCTVKECEGNTYSTSKWVSYSSNLKTTCTSCGNKKANSTHTACI